MNYGSVPGVDKPISRLVQGSTMLSTKQADYSLSLLDHVFANGCNTFDTAHGYGGGDVERIFGRWVNERGVRDKIVVIGKGAHHNQDRQRVTPFDITADLHDSLARFKFDFIDLYLLHRDDPSKPVGPIVEILNEHHRAGKIGAFGGSNWSVARLLEANAYAEANGLKPFVASSPNFSLAVQLRAPWENCVSISGPAGAEERAWYQQSQMPLFFWSSLSGGFFSGRFRRDNLDSFETYGDKLSAATYGTEENFQRLDRVDILGAEKGMSQAQIALAYVLSQPLNAFALAGSATPAEFSANAAAAELKLTPAELAWLNLESDER